MEEQGDKEILNVLNRTLNTEIIFQILEKAEAGNAESQYLLGNAYFAGKIGVKQNFSLALHWLEKSAQSEFPEAQHNLAVMYDMGYGVPKDINKAFYWYGKAAKNNNVLSQFCLATMYSKGEGTPVDIQQAFHWFNKAAQNGQDQAQLNLAIMYYNGQGTAKDIESSFYWICLSAKAGNKEAIKARKTIFNELNPEQIKKIQSSSPDLINEIRNTSTGCCILIPIMFLPILLLTMTILK